MRLFVLVLPAILRGLYAISRFSSSSSSSSTVFLYLGAFPLLQQPSLYFCNLLNAFFVQQPSLYFLSKLSRALVVVRSLTIYEIVGEAVISYGGQGDGETIHNANSYSASILQIGKARFVSYFSNYKTRV
ncbi:hypothetical protein Hdeb2414_s0026g00683601 [Helianthus debilis subsp. tardiflorus]